MGEAVYCLIVDHPDHNFLLASGYVVANCDSLRYLIIGRYGVLGSAPMRLPEPTAEDARTVPGWAASDWTGNSF